MAFPRRRSGDGNATASYRAETCMSAVVLSAGNRRPLNALNADMSKAFRSASVPVSSVHAASRLLIFSSQSRGQSGFLGLGHKLGHNDSASSQEKLVGAPRFELGTPCTPCKCATRLRHAPTGTLDGNRLVRYQKSLTMYFTCLSGRVRRSGHAPYSGAATLAKHRPVMQSAARLAVGRLPLIRTEPRSLTEER
jgi:hypothetical protein